jgi:hypothetical protein
MKRTLRSAVAALVAGLLLGSCITGATDDGDGPDPTNQSDPPGTPAGGGPANVRGSGKVKIEERQVSGFDRISFSGTGDLFIEQTGVETLSVEAEDNLLPLLTSEVSDGLLILGVKPNSSISSTRPIVFRVTIRALKGVEASGSGVVNASGLDVPELEVKTSGTVNSGFSGIADAQVVEISGTGRFDGRGLSGLSASVRVSGAGEAVVNVSETLDIRVEGTGVVRYSGSPEITRQVSGLGRIERI